MMSNMSSEEGIPEFFAGRNVFITGTTGLIGKVLVEKLLRSCPDIGHIYVLMREKKGSSVQERLAKIKATKLFDKLRSERPSAFDKILPVVGDVAEIKLGLSEDDRKTLIENVSVVYHVAASIRFDEAIVNAIKVNTRGTRELVELALEMKKLAVLSHVSTTYCNTDHATLEERVYPPHADWKLAIELAENGDPYVLDVLTPKYKDKLPNTYTFTKSMAEHVVKDMCEGKLPTVIFRPAVVGPTYEEPMPAWIDTINGPTATIAGVGTGLIRSFYKQSGTDPFFHLISLDACVKGIIVSSWLKATTRENCKDISVYNGYQLIVKADGLNDRSLHVIQKRSMEHQLWYPTTNVTGCKYYHYLYVLLFQLIPAILVDSILFLTGHKPLLLKIQRKIFIAVAAMEYFAFNQWNFLNAKFIELDASIPPKDYKDFHVIQKDLNVNSEKFLETIALSGRILLNETKTVEEVEKRGRRLKYLHYTVVSIFGAYMIYFILSKIQQPLRILLECLFEF